MINEFSMKRVLTILAAMIVTMTMFARPQKREVIIDTICEAPIEQMIKVAEKFCYQFQACPDSLFTWAYVGTGELEVAESKSKESRDAIQLRYKDRVYDSKQKTGDVAIDIYVLGVRWWKDQHLGTKYRIEKPANSPYPLTSHMVATYSGSILEGGNFIIRMEPISPTRTRIHYEFSLTFGKVLSAFISDKTWRNAIEWRLSMILDNLVEYAETGTVAPKTAEVKK
jgi:hypothetical protein